MTVARALARGLTGRVLVASAVTTLASTVGALLIAGRSARAVLESTLLGSVGSDEVRRIVSECQRDPETFHYEDSRGTRYRALTSQGRALTAGAEQVDPDLLARWTAGEQAPGRLRGGTYVWIFRGEGRCPLVEATWTGRHGHRDTLARLVVVGVVSSLVVVPWLLMAFVIRPLRRRVARLGEAAASMGRREEYRSPTDGSGDELDVLAASIDRAHQRIVEDTERLSERRDQMTRFLTDVAHDLRTPNTSMRLTLEELDDAVALGPEALPTARAAIRRLIDETVYIGSMTDNLQLASRLEDGWRPMEGAPTVDLVAVVRRVEQREAVFARRKGMSLVVAYPDGALRALGEPTLAEQALTNIVENAIAYGREGGHVAIRLDRLTVGGGAPGDFELVIEDDGPGARPEELPHLPERAFRGVEARRRAPRGSGLGLAIARAFCAEAGWSVELTPTHPGLRVTFRAPVVR